MRQKNRTRNRAVLIVLTLLSASSPSRSQKTGATTPDSLQLESAGYPTIPHVSAGDSLAADSVRNILSPSGIDSVITYSASDSIVYSLRDRTMHLYGDGKIRYKQLGLTANLVDIDWKTSELTAQGVPDSADTTGSGYRGLPEMIDGGETYKGFKVGYDFKTKKGRISLGRTEIGDGYYYGEAIKKVDTDVLFVGDGTFTSCDLEHPHYYFGSPEMKVKVKDEIVARPVYLYISDVPVMGLPFGVFPGKGGRRSGFIAPSYGTNSRGRYLRGLGYYWAMTDYTDINLRADGYTNGSWVLHSDFRYALRYNFSGGVNGSYGRTFTGEVGDPTYSEESAFNIHVGHHQDIDPTAKVDVDFTFTSGNYYQNTSIDFSELLRQQIISNATYQKSWEGTPHSLTINVNRTQDLQTGDVSQILPNIGFTRTQTYPFRFGNTGTPDALYEYLGFSYSGQFRNQNSKTTVNGAEVTEEGRGIQHSIPVSASSKIGYFNVTPFFNYTEKWYDRRVNQSLDPVDSAVVSSDEKGFHAVRFYDTGISLGTKLYGILQPGVFGITGVRHQFSPTLSYTYSPDWSQPRHGYYGTYTAADGSQVLYDLYQKEVFGGAPAGERQSIGLRLGNVFEMKTASTDTSGEENKFQLLNLDLSGSYNLAADSLKFSEISMGYRTQIGDLLNIGGSSRFNLYRFDQTAGKRINKFLIDEEGRLADMTSFSISISTKLSGDKISSNAGPATDSADSLAQTGSGYIGLYEEQKPDFSIPWQLDLTWNFSQSQSNPQVITKSSNLSAGLGFNLTDNWKISASTSYDILNREFAAPQISIYRDLHCWEMNFSWVPTGSNQYYQLQIRLKSAILQDVKVSKQASSSGVF